MKNFLIAIFILLGVALFNVNANAQYPVNRSGVSIVEGNGLSPWEASTTYDIDRVVVMNKRIYVAVVQHHSGATFIPDLANWAELSEGGITEWTTGADYVVGNIVYDVLTDKLYRAVNTHVAGATLSGDLADWKNLSLFKDSASTDNAIVRMDGSDGSAIQETGIIIDDVDNLSTLGKVTAGVLLATSTTDASQPCNPMTEAERDLLTPSASDCIYNISTLATNVYDGSIWIPLESGMDYRIPLMAKGSLLASNGTTNGELLACADDEIIVWDALEPSGIKCSTPPTTSPTTTQGDVIVRGALVDEALPIGTVDQVLTSNGTTASWEDASAGVGLPTMAKGSLVTSNGVGNGEFTACADDEIIVYDSLEAVGFKCEAKPVATTGPLLVEGTASGAYANPCAMSVTVTSKGTPISIIVSLALNTGDYGGFGANGTGGGSATIYRGATLVARTSGISGTNSTKISWTFIDPAPPIGAHTYNLSLPYCQGMKTWAIVH